MNIAHIVCLNDLYDQSYWMLFVCTTPRNIFKKKQPKLDLNDTKQSLCLKNNSL